MVNIRGNNVISTQICSLTFLSLSVTVFILKSTPMVLIKLSDSTKSKICLQ
jgi:hypothetical protein